jgi:hypothetical protein
MFIKELRQGGGETKRWKTYKVETIFEEAKAVGGQGPSLHAHTSRHVLEPNSIQATWWGGEGGHKAKEESEGSMGAKGPQSKVAASACA